MNFNDTLSAFEKTLFTSVEKPNIRTRPNAFRCSALPLCPVKFCLTELQHNGRVPEIDNIGLDVYAGIGTHLHTVLQKWSGYHGKLYGDWEIKKEKRKIVNDKDYVRSYTKTIRGTIGPVVDEVTGQEYTYKELTIKCPHTGLTGHIDGLIPYKDGYIIIDFKTSSTEKIAKMTTPPLNYQAQINAYWYFLEKFGPYDEEEKQYYPKLKIYGTALFFLSRDNPFSDTGRKMFIAKKLDEEMVMRELDNYRRAQKALKNKNYEGIVDHRLCKDRDTVNEQGCEYSVLGCAVSSKKLLKNIEEL
jgi:hypothetical protein